MLMGVSASKPLQCLLLPPRLPSQVLSIDQVYGKQVSKLCVVGRPSLTLLLANGAPLIGVFFLDSLRPIGAEMGIRIRETQVLTSSGLCCGVEWVGPKQQWLDNSSS